MVHVPDEGRPLRTTLPPETEQVGCVMVPTTGIVGLEFTVTGVELLQPSEVLVYVSVTVPAAIPVTSPLLETVAIPPLPDVQVPFVDGVTFAVEPTHTEVAPPNTGRPGMALITTFPDEGEIHPLALVTVKVQVALAGSPVTVKVVPLPVNVEPPGVHVIVQDPEAGRPLSVTLPVGVVQVGCVMIPTDGVVGFVYTVNGFELEQPSEVLV